MKRKTFKTFLTIVSSIALLSFFSCSDVDDDENKSNGGTPTDTSPTSYTNISVGRAYMGGSLIYNQTDSSTNQLKSGTIVAVREGVISPRLETLDVYEAPNNAEGKSYTTGDVEGTAVPSLSTTTKDVMVYEDEADLAVYGYLTVGSVSMDSISFTYTRYGKNGVGKSSKSYKLKVGESTDINSDGTIDIMYRKPDQIREGFEKSMWLEFVCDKDVLTKQSKATTTTMFSVIKTGASRSLVRAADGASVESSEYGLYGVNTSGNYIYLLKGSSNTNTTKSLPHTDFTGYNLKYGDYVIAFDEDTADKLTTNGTVNENGNIENTTQSFVVSYATSDDTNTTLNNETIQSVYKYRVKQFQSNEGPKDLLLHMPNAIFDKLSTEETPVTTERVRELDTPASISLLNKILELGKDATDILLDPANGLIDASDALSDAEKTELETLMSGADNRAKAVRRIIDSLFVQSPKADLLSPSIESMYPYLAVNLGDSIAQTAKEEVFDYDAARALGTASNFEDYSKQKKAIKSKFDQYFAIELKSVDLGKKKDKDGNVEKDENGKEKTNTVTLKDYGVKFALGVKGSVSSTSGRVKAGVAGVIYLDIGVSLLEKGFDQLKAPLEEMLKTEFKKTVMVGAVPLTVGTKLKFELDLEISSGKDKPIDLVFGYIGMYGAGVDVGANYGVNWKGKWCFRIPIPYINFFGDSYAVKETAWYFGTASGSVRDDFSSLTESPWRVTLTPSLTVEPLIGIGPSWANFNVSVPIKPSVPLKFWYSPLIPAFPPLLYEIDLGLGINLKAGLDIKVLIFKINHTFMNKPIVDKTGDKAWTLWVNNDLKNKTW